MNLYNDSIAGSIEKLAGKKDTWGKLPHGAPAKVAHPPGQAARL